MKRKSLICAVASFIMLGSGASFASEEGDPVLEAYAATYNLTYEQARNRFNMIDGVALEEMAILLQNEPGYAGMRLKHQPELRLQILGRGTANALATKVATSLPIDSIDVPMSLADLTAKAKLSSDALKIKRIAHMYDFDLDSGVIDFYLEAASIGNRPVGNVSPKDPGIRVHVVDSVLENTATFIGGQRVVGNENCTSGFTVVNNATPSQRGVITAAHCTLTNTQGATINGVSFSSPVSRLYSGNNDQMWFTANGHTWTNTINTGQSSPSTIPVNGAFSPGVGQILCKFGLTTRQTCGEVISTTATVVDTRNNTTGTWHLARSLDGGVMTEGGDSGGPVFGSGGAALGIVKGRGGVGSVYRNDMYFVPVSRFSAIGVSVLTTP